MSIFKETFRDFVFKQLRIREAIVKQGNNSTTDGSNRHANEGGGGRFGNPRADVETSAGVKEKMTLPAGSFFTNTVVKQCTIRMCSGVDLREDNKILKEGKFERSKDLINEGLAIRYILEGGIPTKSIDFARKRNLKTGGKHFSVPRGDLRKGGYDNPNFGKQYGTSYGDPYIRSDSDGDFGIVPMPGIIDANIRTKTAYGSLREAKVNFVCHNRRQLEIMELLYMRPGYPVLLEWGWTPYISNEGKKEEAFPYLIEFFKQESKINDLQLKILNRKKSSGGNYDGFIGYCKNFDIKSREDGGYDCSTEIIAMGEVLEGLKGKREGKTIIKDLVEYEVDNLEHYLRYFIYILGMHQNANGGAGQENNFSLDFLGGLVELVAPGIELTEFTDREKAFIDNRTLESGGANASNVIRSGPYAGETMTSTDFYALMEKAVNSRAYIMEILDPFFILRGDEVNLEGTDPKFEGIENSESKYAYVRWDLLTTILNKFVFPDASTVSTDEEDSKNNIIPITHITNYRDPLGTTPELLEYSPNPLSRQAQSILTRFTNEQSWWEYFFGGGGVTHTTKVGEISDISVDPKVCLLPHQITVPTVHSRDTGDSITLTQLNPRKTAYVFFELEYLLESFISLRYTDEVLNDDFNIFDFLKKIWEGVNLACVNTHNFTLQTELERPNVVRIVDLNFDTKLKPEDLFEVKIQSNESIVRDFTFNTTLPSSMGATIAVAAQAPKDIETLDSVTFAAFNNNTRYRFNQEQEVNPYGHLPPAEVEKLAKKYDREYLSFKKALQRLLGYSLHILGVDVDPKFTGSKSEASNTIKNIEKRARWLDQHYSSNGGGNADDLIKHYKGQLKPDAYKNPPERSAIIPLKFTAQMDGIGGIVIGNVFKVQKNRLPMGYQGDEVAFVVMGENQKITAGQDWTTDITGQLVLLDLEKEIIEIPPPIATPPPPPLVVVDPPPPPPEMLIIDGDMPIIIQRINQDIITPPPGNTQRFEFPDVNFDTDKSELKDEAKEALDEFAEYMNAHSSYTVDISGHTDSVGSETYNQSLSERRAKAVEDYFINTSGIDPSRLTSRGVGELEPIDTNDTSEGRSNNRRTVFLVQDPDGDIPMNVYHTL